MTLGDIWLLLIGTGIGIFASIVTIIMQRCLDKVGKFKIFYTYNCLRDNPYYLGFIKTEGDSIEFSVPIIFEMQNTSRAIRMIRDLNILLFSNGTRVRETIQIVRSKGSISTNNVVTELREINYGGENAYSFVVMPQSIQCQVCLFLYQISANEIESNHFDEIRLRYYDENGKERIFPMRKIDNCWKPSKLKVNEGWSVLK